MTFDARYSTDLVSWSSASTGTVGFDSYVVTQLNAATKINSVREDSSAGKIYGMTNNGIILEQDIFNTHKFNGRAQNMLGYTWTTQTSNISTGNFWNVSYGNGTWVASGSAGILATSTDNGTTWVSRTSTFGTTTIFSTAYGTSTTGVSWWVAVGNTGQMRKSTDAVTWSAQTSNFGTSSIRWVAFGNGIWIAVGAAGQLRTSTDTITWNTVNSNFGTTIIQSAHYNGNGRWIIAGYRGQLRTSDDNGATWQTQTSNFGTTVINSIAYGNGVWVAGGYTIQLRRSTDNGVTWTTQNANMGNTTINTVAYGNGIWTAVGYTGEIRSSTDGATWTTVTANFGVSIVRGTAYNNDRLMAVGDGGTIRHSFNSSYDLTNLTKYNNKFIGITSGKTVVSATDLEGTWTTVSGISGANNMKQSYGDLYILCDSGVFWKTSDAATWTSFATGISDNFTNIVQTISGTPKVVLIGSTSWYDNSSISASGWTTRAYASNMSPVNDTIEVSPPSSGF